jgi:Dyp-type peroxidase family
MAARNGESRRFGERLREEIRRAVQSKVRITVAEPIINGDNVQGHIVPGFYTRFLSLVFVQLLDIRRARSALGHLSKDLTVVSDLISPGRRQKHLDPKERPECLLNVAFTSRGFATLSVDTSTLDDSAFKQGMWWRSSLLGDCQKQQEHWLVGGPSNEPDLVLIFGAARAMDIRRKWDSLAQLFGRVRVVHVDNGARLSGGLSGCEHFGFRDGISQPRLRGRLLGYPLTHLWPPERRSADSDDLVWPGEFILGYPKKAGDESVVSGDDWKRDGSFMVYRRYVQDVSKFWNAVSGLAAEVRAALPALKGIDARGVAARLIGRWPSGAPIALSPMRDNPKLSDENAFNFIPPLPNMVDQATGDVFTEVRCPLAAHIRKANPRDDGILEVPRIIRRGIPFGPEYPAPGERGLLFLAFQASITDQFEFIQTHWMNEPNGLHGHEGVDPLVGKSTNGNRPFLLALASNESTVHHFHVNVPSSTVWVSGGAYFFAPSVSTVLKIAAGNLAHKWDRV